MFTTIFQECPDYSLTNIYRNPPKIRPWAVPQRGGGHIARSEAGACVVDGKIYVVGGRDCVVDHTTMERFNPSDNIFFESCDISLENRPYMQLHHGVYSSC